MTIRRNNKIETITYSVSSGYMIDIMVWRGKKCSDGIIRDEAEAFLYRADGGAKRSITSEFIDRENTLKDFIDWVKYLVEYGAEIESYEIEEDIDEVAWCEADEEGRFDHVKEVNKRIFG